jgi:Fic family protein
MVLFETPTLTTRELDVIERIDAIRDALRHQLPEQRKWVGLLRRVSLARAIRGSNSIEGFNVSLSEAVAAVAGELPSDPSAETWQAVLGYRDALSYVLQLADDVHFFYDANLLRGLHHLMLKYAPTKSPGRWRQGAVYVHDDSSREIVYTGPDATDVPGLVQELVEYLRQDAGERPMVRAAMAHLNLAMIHPFRDGNGRMARCLQTLVLAREGIIAAPFSSIEEYLGENTAAYYAVLTEVGQGSWHPERDATPWIRFVLTAHYRQAQTLIQRAAESEQRWSMVEELAGRASLPTRCIPALFNASMGFRLRNATYRELADVNETIAGRDLKAVAEAGLLEATGERRGRSYLAGPTLQSVDRAVRQSRHPVGDPFDPRDSAH